MVPLRQTKRVMPSTKIAQMVPLPQTKMNARTLDKKSL